MKKLRRFLLKENKYFKDGRKLFKKAYNLFEETMLNEFEKFKENGLSESSHYNNVFDSIVEDIGILDKSEDFVLGFVDKATDLLSNPKCKKNKAHVISVAAIAVVSYIDCHICVSKDLVELSKYLVANTKKYLVVDLIKDLENGKDR